MAILTKSRSKKALAEGSVMLGKSTAGDKTTINIAVRSDEETSKGHGTWYTVSLSLVEANSMIDRLQNLINKGVGS